MKSGAQLALGLAAGYFLGRSHRMRLAIMIGAAAATGGIGGAGRQLLRRGTKLVASSEVMNEISPALGEITDTIRGELVDAAKDAALAAVSSRIDALSDNLHGRAEALRHPEELAEDVGGRVRDVGRLAGLGGQEPEEGEEEEREEEEAPVSHRRAPRPRRPPAEPEEEQEPEEPEAGEEVAEEPPVRRRGRPSRPAAGSPIRRARR